MGEPGEQQVNTPMRSRYEKCESLLDLIFNLDSVSELLPSFPDASQRPSDKTCDDTQQPQKPNAKAKEEPLPWDKCPEGRGWKASPKRPISSSVGTKEPEPWHLDKSACQVRAWSDDSVGGWALNQHQHQTLTAAFSPGQPEGDTAWNHYLRLRWEDWLLTALPGCSSI